MTTNEAIEILRRAKEAAFSKRSWKQDLSIAWSQGNYATFGWRDMDGELQRIRNQFGPSWLVRVSIKK